MALGGCVHVYFFLPDTSRVNKKKNGSAINKYGCAVIEADV
jgi:hypothetical protein